MRGKGSYLIRMCVIRWWREPRPTFAPNAPAPPRFSAHQKSLTGFTAYWARRKRRHEFRRFPPRTALTRRCAENKSRKKLRARYIQNSRTDVSPSKEQIPGMDGDDLGVDKNFTWAAEKKLWRLGRLGGMVDIRYAFRPRSWPNPRARENGYVPTIVLRGLTVFGQEGCPKCREVKFIRRSLGK